MNHPGGVLEGMDETDIALESGWEDEPMRFIAALLECGLLEKTGSGAYALHDWNDHQGYVIYAERRKEQARHAACVRWDKRTEQMPDTCGQHTGGNEASDEGQCPLPSPAPSPFPTPEPTPVPAPTADRAVLKGEKLTKFMFPEDAKPYRLAVLMRDTLKAHVPTLKEPNLHT